MGGEKAQPMKSMTGYGRREAEWKEANWTVEVRSVNHRYCEVIARLPKGLGMLEDDLKQCVRQRCERGRVEITLSMSGGGSGLKSLALDRPVATQYYRLLKTLQKELHLGGEVDVGLLAGFRDVFLQRDQQVNGTDAKRMVLRLTKGALTDLDKMRRREGQALLLDTLQRLRTIKGVLRKVARRIPLGVHEHFVKMKERVAKLLDQDDVNIARLHQELALYADRCDVTEELTRLESHLDQFHATVKGKGVMGRRLDFLIQEMGREVNTIGSKANDAEVGVHVVELKTELEKIREQIQNIE